jgi:hypothetical protein
MNKMLDVRRKSGQVEIKQRGLIVIKEVIEDADAELGGKVAVMDDGSAPMADRENERESTGLATEGIYSANGGSGERENRRDLCVLPCYDSAATILPFPREKSKQRHLILCPCSCAALSPLSAGFASLIATDSPGLVAELCSKSFTLLSCGGHFLYAQTILPNKK